MPYNQRGQRVNTHNKNKQKAQADALRQPKKSTGANEGGTIGSTSGASS